MATFNVRPDIDAAAAKLSNTFGAKREIKRLPEVLWEGELVDMLATGTYANGTGIVAMTNMRLLFLKHGVMSQTVEDFPYGKVSSVQWYGGLVLGTLAVYTSGNRADIKNMPKAQGKAMADKLRMHIAQGTQPGALPLAVPASVQGQDVASRLATLDQLRAAAAITEAEYQDRRKAIIDSL